MPRIRVRLDAPRDRSYTVEIKPGILPEIPIHTFANGREEADVRHHRCERPAPVRACACEPACLCGMPGVAPRRPGGGALEKLRRREGTLREALPRRDQPGQPRHRARRRRDRRPCRVRRRDCPARASASSRSPRRSWRRSTAASGERWESITLRERTSSAPSTSLRVVYIDPEVLATLPPEEFRNGFAEVVKIAAALDAPFFTQIEKNTPASGGRTRRSMRKSLRPPLR